jgi:large subunit ribosomal protein L5
MKQRYVAEAIPALKSEFGYQNAMQVPRLEKIVVNIGLGEALTNSKAVDAAVGDLGEEVDRNVQGSRRESSWR